MEDKTRGVLFQNTTQEKEVVADALSRIKITKKTKLPKTRHPSNSLSMKRQTTSVQVYLDVLVMEQLLFDQFTNVDEVLNITTNISPN